MFVFTCTAISKKNSEFPDNEKHAALAFVIADDLNQAENRLGKEMNELGWFSVMLQKSGQVSGENLIGKDEILVNTFKDAQKHGFGVVIYTDPIID